MNKVWIDTETGTWGNATHLVVVDLDQYAEVNGHDVPDVVEHLSEVSDNERAEIGRIIWKEQYGEQLLTEIL